jgi:hypothetical protein
LSSPNVPETTDWFNLDPEDARALDALVDAGFDIDAVPSELKERAERVARLLGQLETPVEAGSSDLVDRTLGLVHGQMLQGRAVEDEPVLCPADEDALEAWVMSGGKMPSVPGALRKRARKHEALAQLVSTTPVATAGRSTDELIAATLQRIDSAESIERDRMQIGSGRRLRLTDILSVAAVVLLGVSVAFPVFGNLRDGSRRAICDTNLGRVASALGIYAGANDDSLPMMTAGFGGRPWIRVGEDPKQSNSANLYVLVRNQYTDLANLACPGNPNAPTLETRRDAQDWQRLEEVSFSYQVQDGRRVRRLWDAPVAVPVVADRSPVILRIVRHEPIQPEANSPNHGSRGQHIIWTDSSVSWASSPVLDSGDNIWLPRSIEKIVAQARRYYGMEGNEVSDSVNDALLGP